MSNQNSKVFIDYDTKHNKLVLTIPFYLNDKARAIPNRRWNSKMRGWFVPVTRKNIEYLREEFGSAPRSEIAAKVIDEYVFETVDKGQEPFPAWYRFKTTPLPKQLEGLNAVNGLESFGLFMGMGTGKTKVIIDTVACRAMRGDINAALIVCPVAIRRNWVSEIAKHSPLGDDVVQILDGVSFAKRWDKFISKTGFKWLICGTETLSTSKTAIEYSKRFLISHRGLMAVDESSLIKTHDSQRTRNCTQIGRLAKSRVIATGTEITQGIQDLYSQFEFLDEGIIGLGDFFSFRNRYMVMGGYENRQVIGYTNQEELFRALSPHIFRARKEDVIDIEQKTYMPTRFVEMSKAQQGLYDKVARLKGYGRVMFEGHEIKIENPLEKMLRLQQISRGFFTSTDGEEKITTRISDSPVVRELINVLDELPKDEKVVIWSVFKFEIQQIVSAIAAKYKLESVVEYHGGIKDDERFAGVNRFRNDPNVRFFVGNPYTGKGMGINLIESSTMIYCTNPTSYEVRSQSEDRIHRNGQIRPCVYMDISVDCESDAAIRDALALKMDLADYIRENVK